MEKYRRWTDEKVGVNPFVAAKTEVIPLTGKLLSFIAILIKGTCFLAYLPLFVFLYLLPIALIKQTAARVLLFLFGVYQIQDFSLERCERQGRLKIILSNHSCFIDIVYYLYRYPGYSFLGFAEDSNQNITYFVLTPLKAFFLSLTQLQPFYVKGSTGKYVSLKELLKEEFGDQNAGKLLVFYEKIRTNGRGTIKIARQLSTHIYELAQDCLIVQLKYSSKRNDLHSLTSSSLGVLLAALGTTVPGNNLKIRATKQASNQTHSSNELREAVGSMATGPLLETQPCSYFEFIEFFKKTQKEGYKPQ